MKKYGKVLVFMAFVLVLVAIFVCSIKNYPNNSYALVFHLFIELFQFRNLIDTRRTPGSKDIYQCQIIITENFFCISISINSR